MCGKRDPMLNAPAEPIEVGAMPESSDAVDKGSNSVGAVSHLGGKDVPKRTSAWDKANVICQIAIAAIACVGIFLTLRLEHLTHYQIELDESAQLMLEGGTISYYGKPVPLFELRFRNTGRTPSENGSATMVVGLLDRRDLQNMKPLDQLFNELPKSELVVPVPTI